MNYLDYSVIVLYTLIIVVVGCGAGYWLRQKKKALSSDVEGEGGYFLAAKTLRWPVIGLALFSTNISTIHLVSMAQAGYNEGLVKANFELLAGFTLILLALFFAPFYLRSRIATLPDFLEKRYCRGARDWLSVVSIGSAIFIHIGFSLYTGAVVILGLMGMNSTMESYSFYINVAIIAIALVTGLYTVVGGLFAVVITEAIQTFFLLLGALLVTILGYQSMGGWAELKEAVNNPVLFSLARAPGEPGDPWFGFLLGYPIIGIWYWCADQTIVQRVLGARSENDARVGPIFAGFIKVLPMFIIVMPGLICLGLVNSGKLPPLTDSTQVYSHMIMNLLPAGLRGLMVAALLAALMSTVAGALNSIATLFSFDLVKRFKPDIPDRSLVKIGRWATVMAMIAAIIWSPFVGQFSQLFDGMALMICYVAPPITAVFVVGVFWKRANGISALWTLWTGLALGALAFSMTMKPAAFEDIPVLRLLIAETPKGPAFAIHWLVCSFLICGICCILQVAISLISKQRPSESAQALAWGHPLEALADQGWKGLGNYKILSLILIAVLVTVYACFW
jgi:SSS family solute:Na+ symporter